MPRRIALVILSALACGAAAAAETSITCENPRREYVAHVDRDTNALWIEVAGGITHYQVREIVNADDGFIVHGTTVDDGPDFAAHISSDPRIDFLVDGEITQTDDCE